MSLLSNPAQIKLAQTNHSANTQNKTQTQNGSSLSGSSFFDILRTVADNKSSMKFNTPAKLSDSARNRSSTNVSAGTVAKAENNAVTQTGAEDNYKSVNAVNSSEQNNSENTSVKTKRSKSVDAIVVEKSISGEDNTEESSSIKINLTEVLQLLGISPGMAQKLLGDYHASIQQGGDVISAVTASIANSDLLTVNYVGGEDAFIDLDGVMQILNGIAQSDFDGLNLSKEAFENASDFALKLESIVNGKPASELNIDAVKDVVTGYVKEKVMQEIYMHPSHHRLSDVAEVGGGRDYLFKFLEDNNINIDDIGIQEIKFFTSDQQTKHQNVFDAVNLMRNGALKTSAQAQTTETTVMSVTYPNENIAEDNSLAAIRIRNLNRPGQALQNISQVQANNMNNTNSNQTMNLGLRQETLAADSDTNGLTASKTANPIETTRIEQPTNSNVSKANDALLTGIVDARSPVMINDTTQKIIELKTHISNVANELSGIIVKNKTESGFSVKMRLAPEGLGEILVKVTYNKGNVNLNVIAENKAAEAQLMSQVEGLKESLASHNFSLSGFDVETRGSGHGYNQQDNQNRNGGNNQRYNQPNESSELAGNNNIGEIQRLSNVYMNRLVYRTV